MPVSAPAASAFQAPHGAGRVAAEQHQQRGRGQRKAQGQEQHGRDAGQRGLDQHEGGAPDHACSEPAPPRPRAAGSPAAPRGRDAAPRIRSSSRRKMRFRPRSRPSGRNHSCVVWAPPPTPPAADGDGRNAQRERNIGVGGGAIQVRANAQVRIHGAHVLQNGGVLGQRRRRARADLLHFGRRPCRRWRAGFRYRGRAPWPPSSRSTSSSIFWLLSERMSTLARAVWGMALTPDPPSISPTLNGRFGRALQARFRRTAPPRGTAHAADCPRRNRSSYGRRGRVKAISKRRLPRRAVGDVVDVGAIHHHQGLDLARQRRLLGRDTACPAGCPRPPRPHWPPAAGRSRESGQLRRTLFQTRAMASRAARPAPLSATPGPRKRPSASTEISSFPRGAITVSRCAVSAT